MILEMRDICKDYPMGKGVAHILKNVNLDVEEGEYLAIMGPSGSGKTTLMNIIGCLDVPTSGTYILDGENGYPLEAEELQAGETVYVYIGPAMTMSLPPQTTGEVIIGKIPADQKAPEYITAVSMTANADESWTLVSAAGKEYAVSADCRIMPYLTRQIVSLEDVEQGSNLLVWSDDQNQAQKLVLFAK